MQDSVKTKRVFFPNLNGIRAVAALMVFLHHVEQIKQLFNLPTSYHDNPMGTNLGGLGVTLFFVLSGFLITFLLLTEKDACGVISLPDFYIRRLLRIWPLYYLIIGLGFLVIPQFFPELLVFPGYQPELLISALHDKFGTKLMLDLFFMPNLTMTLFSVPVFFAAQIWSIGVEEQFYLVWPVLVNYCHCRRLPILMLTIIAVFVAINLSLTINGSVSPGVLQLKQFLLLTRIDCMAVGGLAAWLLYRDAKMLESLYSKSIQVTAYLAVTVMMWYQVSSAVFNHLSYSILFAMLILNLAANPKTILSLNNRVFDYLGRISYSLYMYHVLAIVVVVKALTIKKLDFSSFRYGYVAVYGLSLCLTIVISALSYELFEKFFLRKKIRFSTIISGDNAAEPFFAGQETAAATDEVKAVTK